MTLFSVITPRCRKTKWIYTTSFLLSFLSLYYHRLFAQIYYQYLSLYLSLPIQYYFFNKEQFIYL